MSVLARTAATVVEKTITSTNIGKSNQGDSKVNSDTIFEALAEKNKSEYDILDKVIDEFGSATLSDSKLYKALLEKMLDWKMKDDVPSAMKVLVPTLAKVVTGNFNLISVLGTFEYYFTTTMLTSFLPILGIANPWAGLIVHLAGKFAVPWVLDRINTKFASTVCGDYCDSEGKIKVPEQLDYIAQRFNYIVGGISMVWHGSKLVQHSLEWAMELLWPETTDATRDLSFESNSVLTIPKATTPKAKIPNVLLSLEHDQKKLDFVENKEDTITTPRGSPEVHCDNDL